MVDLDLDTFLSDGGIYRNTIHALFGCDEFFLQRQQVFTNFFKDCMTNPVTSNEIITLLFGLTKGYLNLYNSLVTKTSGPLEKRHRAGKLMIQKFESSRITLVEEHVVMFSSLSGTKEHLLLLEDETFLVNKLEDSNLLFGFLELYLYENFWKWLHTAKGVHVSNFIKERPDDSNYPFSVTMLDKIYDVTGYLCGARLFNLLKYNRLKGDYRYVFNEYYTNSRYPNGSMALKDDMPANYLIFRQHSEGLYFARSGNFEIIKIMQAIYMQSLSTDVLILFNSCEPVKLVHQLILNSIRVQAAFKQSCYMLQDCFDEVTNLAEEKKPICYLYQFLVQGFISVYSKDIYQLRLSNVLLSKTGASGIRTALLTLSADAQKKKSSSLDGSHPPTTIINPNICLCGREFTGKGWYARHILSCGKYLSQQSPIIPAHASSEMNVYLNELEPTAVVSSILDNLIELEGLEENGDYDDDDNNVLKSKFIELNLDEEEILFDSKFVSNILIDDN